MQMPFVEACDFPATSLLDRKWFVSAYFRDAYCTVLLRPQASTIEIFTAIFAHHPRWMKWVLILRHQVVALFGIAAPGAAEVWHFERRSAYRAGERIGVWPIIALSDNELVVGRDNAHLDFRLSLQKVPAADGVRVVVSTLCEVHNRFGKLYLFLIAPFHRWGVQYIIARALRAGRL